MRSRRRSRILLLILLPAVALAAAATLAAPDPGRPPMARYVFGLLRRGPAWSAERTAATDSLQRGHMANIQRMADEGVLLGAGPFLDRGDLRGVFIFRGDSVAAIRLLAERDPAIGAGRLQLDLHPWRAPAGIGQPYRRLAARPGHRDSMVRMPLGLLKKGPKWMVGSTPELERLEQAHLDHLMSGLSSGTLAAAGPLTDAGDLRGVLVFRGDSAAVQRWTAADPAVRAGRLVLELHPWIVGYGVMPGDTLAR